MIGTEGGTEVGTLGDIRDMPRIADGGTGAGRHTPFRGYVPCVPSAASRFGRRVPSRFVAEGV